MESRVKKYRIRLLSLLLMLLIIGSSSFQVLAAPGLNAAVTKENILAILDTYDKDGAYLVRNSGSPNPVTEWWGAKDRLIDKMDTVVHESFHYYTYYKHDKADAFYIGSQRTSLIYQTPVFRSSLMAAKIPASMRTFRYDTYLGEGSAKMASNAQGIYGLFNEFTAYYWGMHTALALYDYYEKVDDQDIYVWQRYVTNCTNDMMAYEEFQYYMLQYLQYAKKNYPKVYQSILLNKEFMSTWQLINRAYRAQIEEYTASLPKIVENISRQGYHALYEDGMLYINEKGAGVQKTTFQGAGVLYRELSTGKYTSLEKELGITAGLKDIGTNVSRMAKIKVKMGGELHYFELSSNGKNLAYAGPVNRLSKMTSLTIPKAIEISGRKYKVTEIAAGACEKMKKLKLLFLPDTITEIGEKAFSGCTRLRKIEIVSKKLKKKKIGKNAFAGIGKNAVIFVPKNKVKNYRSLMTARGLHRKAKVRAIVH
ncbi:MAG: leucine-rich repeat protein [Eubacteriales bacterium]|nr:leucine-rich repeat protein [Eubacteriales bacterium]